MNIRTLAALLMSGLMAASLGFVTPAFADDNGNGDDQSMQQGSDDGASADQATSQDSGAADSGSTADTASGDDDF